MASAINFPMISYDKKFYQGSLRRSSATCVQWRTRRFESGE